MTMIAGILLAFLAVTAQEAEEPLPPVGDEPVDEVTVYAEETITVLRRKLRVVDERFFSRYNDINTNDDFDMVCKRETRIGSQIPRQVCRSRLHRARLSEAAEDVLDEGVSMGEDSIGWTRQHYRAVREDIGKLMKQDAELRGIVRDRKSILDEIGRKKNAADVKD
ncbi:MAG: hypothetical protein AAF917_03560 [Pseudomonadota bacterium]